MVTAAAVVREHAGRRPGIDLRGDGSCRRRVRSARRAAALVAYGDRATGVAYDAGRVYAFGDNADLHAFDARDGRLLWTRKVDPSGATPGNAVVAIDGTVYLGRPNPAAIRGRDGQVLWRATDRHEAYAPAVDDARSYITHCSAVAAFGRSGGEAAWRWNGAFCGTSALALRPPTVHRGRVYHPLSGTVLDAASGRRLGAYPPRTSVFAGGIGVGGDEAGLRAYDLETGAARWRVRDRDRRVENAPRFVAPAVAVHQAVYWVTRGNRLTAFALDTGEPLWAQRLAPGGEEHRPASISLGAAPGLLLVPVGRRLTAYQSLFRPAAGGVAWDASPRDVEFLRDFAIQGVLAPDLRTAGRRVTVQWDEHPYGSWRSFRPVRPKPDGYFDLAVRNERNTRFRVRTAGVTTPALTVYTYPRVAYRMRRGRGAAINRVTATVSLRFDRELRLRGRRLHLYLGRVRARRLDRLGSARLTGAGAGRARARVTFAARSTGRRDFLVVCVPRAWRLGIGARDAFARRCGARRVRMPR